MAAPNMAPDYQSIIRGLRPSNLFTSSWKDAWGQIGKDRKTFMDPWKKAFGRVGQVDKGFQSRWDTTQDKILGMFDKRGEEGLTADEQELIKTIKEGMNPVSTSELENVYADARKDYKGIDPRAFARRNAADARIRGQALGRDPNVSASSALGAGLRQRANRDAALAAALGSSSGFVAGQEARVMAGGHALNAAGAVADVRLANQQNVMAGSQVWAQVLGNAGAQLGALANAAVANVGNYRGHLADQYTAQGNLMNSLGSYQLGSQASQNNLLGTLGTVELGFGGQKVGAFGHYTNYNANNYRTDQMRESVKDQLQWRTDFWNRYGQPGQGGPMPNPGARPPQQGGSRPPTRGRPPRPGQSGYRPPTHPDPRNRDGYTPNPYRPPARGPGNRPYHY